MTIVFLEHISGDHVGEFIELDKGEIVIGRLSNCDIVTEPTFTSVSQCHCVLRRTKEGWTITDSGTYGKGSSYGTYVNDVHLIPNEPKLLGPGDELRLGTKIGKYFRFLGEGTIPVREPIQLKERLRIDTSKRRILLDGRELSLNLTNQEYELVLMLWQRSGEVCTFAEICERIWPNEKILSLDSVDADLRVRINTLVHTLRRKMSLYLGGIDIFVNYRGIGYRIRF